MQIKNCRSWTLMLALAVGILVTNAVPSAAVKYDHSLIVGKKGETTLTQDTRVGKLTLRPGRYTFQFQTVDKDYFLHVTEVAEQDAYYGSDSGGAVKAHLGDVKCRLDPLGKKVQNTAVYVDSGGGIHRITRIELAGGNVAHEF